MKLTKEECLEALNYLASGQCSYCWKSGNEEVLVYEDANKMLTQLINEHFDNQPLKFEELKQDMFVWDKDFNSWGEYLIVIEKCIDEYSHKYIKAFATGCEETMIRSFKENRFYRKQVEEE